MIEKRIPHEFRHIRRLKDLVTISPLSIASEKVKTETEDVKSL